MIACRSPAFQQANLSAGIESGCRDDSGKVFQSNMVRTRTGDQRPARTEHFHRAEIEFLVAAQGTFGSTLRFGESWRIKNDRVEFAARIAPIAEQVEGIRLNPIHRDIAKSAAIQFEVLVGDFKGSVGRIDAGNLPTDARKMERETAVVGTDIEGFAAAVAGGGSVVLALIEKGARFLAEVCIIVKAETIEIENGRGGSIFRTIGSGNQWALGGCAQLFQLANSQVSALKNCSRTDLLADNFKQNIANHRGVHPLRKYLQNQQIAVFINDQSREEVGFAEDQTAGVGVFVGQNRLTQGYCGAKTLFQ